MFLKQKFKNNFCREHENKNIQTLETKNIIIQTWPDKYFKDTVVNWTWHSIIYWTLETKLTSLENKQFESNPHNQNL